MLKNSFFRITVIDFLSKYVPSEKITVYTQRNMITEHSKCDMPHAVLLTYVFPMSSYMSRNIKQETLLVNILHVSVVLNNVISV